MEFLVFLGFLVLAMLYLLLTFDLMHRTAAALLMAGIVFLLDLIFHFSSFPRLLGGIDVDTILLLMSMMIIVGALKETGMFQALSLKFMHKFKGHPFRLLFFLFVLTGIISAFIDNVTTVLLIAPVIVDIFQEIEVSPIPALLGIVFASNIGGTATLIGDPPNILIGSIAKIGFMPFIYNLTPIIAVNLLAFSFLFPYLFRGWYREYSARLAKVDDSSILRRLEVAEEKIDRKLMSGTLGILGLVISLFFFEGVFQYPPAIPAIIGAGLLMILLRRKMEIEKIMSFISWPTLVFFMGMFIVIQGVQGMGVLEWIADSILGLTTVKLYLLLVITWISAFLSAFIDNIPFVMSMIPVIQSISAKLGLNAMPMYWALSLGGCLGGNGTMVGASANIVVVSLAAEEGYDIKFRYFMKYGMPVMIFTIVLASIYLAIRYRGGSGMRVKGPVSMEMTTFEMIKNGTWKYERGKFFQALWGPKGPILVMMDENFEIVAEKLSQEEKKFAEEKISFIFGFEDDLDSFYSSLDKPFEFLAEEFYGLRVPAAPCVYQAMIEVIAQQQIKFEMAIRNVRRLVEKVGRRIGDLFLFPLPRDVLSLGEEGVKETGMGMRTKYIVGCTREFLEGRLDLEAIWEMSEEEAMKYLTSFRGIGKWTAELFLVYGYRKNTYPASDLGIRRGIAKIFGKRLKEVDEKFVREVIDPYGKWAPTLAFYITCYDRRTEILKKKNKGR